MRRGLCEVLRGKNSLRIQLKESPDAVCWLHRNANWFPQRRCDEELGTAPRKKKVDGDVDFFLTPVGKIGIIPTPNN